MWIASQPLSCNKNPQPFCDSKEVCSALAGVRGLYQFRVHGPRFMAAFKRGGSVPEDGRCENVPW